MIAIFELGLIPQTIIIFLLSESFEKLISFLGKDSG